MFCLGKSPIDYNERFNKLSSIQNFNGGIINGKDEYQAVKELLLGEKTKSGKDSSLPMIFWNKLTLDQQSSTLKFLSDIAGWATMDKYKTKSANMLKNIIMFKNKTLQTPISLPTHINDGNIKGVLNSIYQQITFEDYAKKLVEWAGNDEAHKKVANELLNSKGSDISVINLTNRNLTSIPPLFYFKNLSSLNLSCNNLNHLNHDSYSRIGFVAQLTNSQIKSVA